MAKIGKRSSYQQLIRRLDAALRERFFLEACWIEYAILEDRVDSALAKTGGPLPKSRPMLGEKLVELEGRLPADPLLKTEMERDAVLTAAKQWKDKRNPLMHSMANEEESWSAIEAEAEAVALEGRVVVGRMASAVMRLRKKRLKGR